MIHITRMLRTAMVLGLAVFMVGVAQDADAQAADAKRALKAGKSFYALPGMIDVEIRAMRGTLMITGSVPSEDLIAKADELGGKVRGIKEVRNRLRVRPPVDASVTDADLKTKIQEKIDKDEDLARSQAKKSFEWDVTDGNVTLKGKLPDWTVAQSFLGDLRRMPGIKTIQYNKLKY